MDKNKEKKRSNPPKPKNQYDDGFGPMDGSMLDLQERMEQIDLRTQLRRNGGSFKVADIALLN